MLPWSLGSGKEVVEGCLILGPEPDLGKLAVSDPGDDYLQALVRATPALHPLDHQAAGVIVATPDRDHEVSDTMGSEGFNPSKDARRGLSARRDGIESVTLQRCVDPLGRSSTVEPPCRRARSAQAQSTVGLPDDQSGSDAVEPCHQPPCDDESIVLKEWLKQEPAR
jgi:hypothetical protein